MGQSLGSPATVKSVFGRTIQVEGKTVDSARAAGMDRERRPRAGGGVRAFPAGALEITQTGTRFIPYSDFRWIAGAFAAGALLGSLLSRRK